MPDNPADLLNSISDEDEKEVKCQPMPDNPADLLKSISDEENKKPFKGPKRKIPLAYKLVGFLAVNPETDRGGEDDTILPQSRKRDIAQRRSVRPTLTKGQSANQKVAPMMTVLEKISKHQKSNIVIVPKSHI
jgi:hypothetical protein